MKFGWINISGAVIVILMIIPNIIYALRNKNEKNLCRNRFMNIIEQAGRYGCIVFMWLPLLVWEFGFSCKSAMLVYFIGNSVLLAVYLIVFAVFLKEKTSRRALILAVLPSCIFLISGLLLKHWLLVGFAVLFSIGHIYVTIKNIKPSESKL